ncbi:secreted RxLR effector protein 161-like [Nicotiana tabacum]|uniref:Secreted RxLR effector protein 161-like n=1 Tax=Nicotiana tabacum TaxID=4097 RepID=A0AC58UC52_TOBAC
MNENTKSVSTPLAPHFKLSAAMSPKNEVEREYMSRVPYANAVGDLDKRRSTTGYVFTFANAPVSWKSTLQSTVALSTTEAEFMEITEAVKEAI